jgi:putative FmdB family regulatory protein
MPAYDFQCDACGTMFEARLCFTEAEQGRVAPCPECRGAATRRLMSRGINIVTGKPFGTSADVKPSGSGGGCCGGGSCGCR